MNGIVINQGEDFYTDLKGILESLGNDGCYKYNWLITDYECYPQENENAATFSGSPVFITGEKLMSLLEIENFQWI